MLSCHKQHATASRSADVQPSASAVLPPREQVDVAKLITADEIRSVLGEDLKQAVPSRHMESGFAIAQCYFLLATPSKSAVLTLTSRDTGPGGHSPREFWMEKFHGDSRAEKGEEEERKPAPPEPIAGLGDEAFWVETGSTGALYVLQGERFLRVAIGGTDEKATRVEKAKKLAQFALKRMPLRQE